MGTYSLQVARGYAPYIHKWYCELHFIGMRYWLLQPPYLYAKLVKTIGFLAFQRENIVQGGSDQPLVCVTI